VAQHPSVQIEFGIPFIYENKVKPGYWNTLISINSIVNIKNKGEEK
jgi:hypothetical protein